MKRDEKYFKGCILGGAIGDALGRPIELKKLKEIKATYGSKGINNLTLNDKGIAEITDDTQMTLFTAEGILRANCKKGRCYIPAVVYNAYLRWYSTQRNIDTRGYDECTYNSYLLKYDELYEDRGAGNTCLTSLSKEEIGSIKNPINKILNQGIGVSENVGELLKNAQAEMPKVKSLLASLSGFSENAEGTIAVANEKIPEAKAILNDFIDAISKINNSEDTKDLINFLKNDVMTNVDFLKSPVDIVQKTIYPMTNYGASMTPFYTTLCLWVGILLLTSLLTTEVHVKGEDDDEYKPYQVYLGRGLTFLSIALIQALIVSLGNIFILKVHMDNPLLFTMIALFVSAVFNFIVYSLVSIFGNIGKAVGVILLVLQVAGSGGTFPIQVTPKFFQMIYPFLPFTYGISAMREAIGGVYMPNLTRDISVLLIFLILSIVINIFLKAPINKLFHKFISKLEGSRLTE